jgi:hypothetical protein
MKLRIESGKWILPSAIVAIVMLIAILLGFTFWWLHYIPWKYQPWMQPLYPILVTGCLFFFPTAIYIHGVTNKYSRAIVATRVLGTIGAFAGLFGLQVGLLSPVGILIPLMAIGGVTLTQTRPKVAGVLMLLAGIIPWIVMGIHWLLGWIFGEYYLYHLDIHPEHPLFTVYLLVFASAFLTRPASLFLIPGGALALASLKKPLPPIIPPILVTVILWIIGIITIVGIIWIIWELFDLVRMIYFMIKIPPPPIPLRYPKE